MTPQALDPTLDLTGRVIDGLALLRLVGRGATSSVYQALETGADRRMVAVKVMDPTEQRLQRSIGGGAHPFERDLQFSRVLSHHSVARVLRLGETVDGVCFAVLEWVEGVTLAQELELRGALEWKESLAWMLAICRSVGEFHRMNMIHRDVAPGNVMLRHPRKGEHRIKLIDFGSAKFGSENDAEGTTLFELGNGTPFYLAPEQALGHGSTRRSDVFSLGAVFYHLLAGRPALSLKRPTAYACVEYLRAGRSLPSIPLAECVSPDTPRSLVRLVETCLSLDPERRLPDADALADACRRFMSARDLGEGPPVGTFWRRVLRSVFRRNDDKGSKFMRRE